MNKKGSHWTGLVDLFTSCVKTIIFKRLILFFLICQNQSFFASCSNSDNVELKQEQFDNSQLIQSQSRHSEDEISGGYLQNS